ncbi:terminase [Bradyrhizobium manausense]|uniref:Terminase n=1 Tax=Bradyrhizobium manausense TaxID=989370 RepID=A0A0R3D1S3_9BRAD|nr:terminase [Bradyrhizobium manausense]
MSCSTRLGVGPLARDPKPVADAIRAVPKPPAHFGPSARAEWKRIMPVLVKRRVLSPADLHAAERFCEAASDIADAREAIAQQGGYIENRLGETKRHPAFTTLREATANSKMWASELGLTPKSRNKAGATEDGDDGNDNPLAVN